MSENRKDQHIRYALEQSSSHNSFDEIELIHRSLPLWILAEIDLTTHFAGRDWEFLLHQCHDRRGVNEPKRSIKVGSSSRSLWASLVTGSYSAGLKDPNDQSYAVKKTILIFFSNQHWHR